MPKNMMGQMPIRYIGRMDASHRTESSDKAVNPY